MRLDPHEVETIRASVRRRFGAGARVRLFGSRVDDTRRGGDIDLHVVAETAERASLAEELAFRAEMRDLLGDQKVDVVLRPPGFTPRPIDRIAIETGVVLA